MSLPLGVPGSSSPPPQPAVAPASPVPPAAAVVTLPLAYGSLSVGLLAQLVAPEPPDLRAVSELVVRSRAGNVAAFDVLVRRYWRLVFVLLCRMRNGDKFAAEEFTQAAFVKIWKRRRRLEPSKSFKSFVLQVAMNLTRDDGRKLAVRIKREKPLGAEEDPASVAGSAPPDVCAKDDQLVFAAAKLAMRRAMDRLQVIAPEHLQVLLLRLLDAMTYSEIAEVVGFSERWVSDWRTSCLPKLRELFLEEFAKLGYTPIDLNLED